MQAQNASLLVGGLQGGMVGGQDVSELDESIPLLVDDYGMEGIGVGFDTNADASSLDHSSCEPGSHGTSSDESTTKCETHIDRIKNASTLSATSDSEDHAMSGSASTIEGAAPAVRSPCASGTLNTCDSASRADELSPERIMFAHEAMRQLEHALACDDSELEVRFLLL